MANDTKTMPTAFGCPAGNGLNTTTAGHRGPALLQDAPLLGQRKPLHS